MTHKQQLFQRFPIDGSVVVAGEESTTPYHIYNGTILSLGGTVDGKVAARFLAAENLEPVLDTDGRALAAIWICDFTEANLDAHHELQISFFATRHKEQPLRADAFSFYRALKLIPDLMMVCHGLWNNTQRVVRYNSEHLLLNARLTKSEVVFSGDYWTFRFRDAAGGLIAGFGTGHQASAGKCGVEDSSADGSSRFFQSPQSTFLQVACGEHKTPGRRLQSCLHNLYCL
ncbi:hypothetical protein [Brucella gallinifaecis]|uniref:hypothetical protein n=1 Tax=Brucella gallinifaecis TaxID=215590 RepID=UPI00235EDF46|nr:hypothetical protein [Brucella gallinifaecis]